MKQNNKLIPTIICLIVTVILIASFLITNSGDRKEKKLLDNMQLTIEDVVDYEYNKDALNGDEKTDEYGISNLSDLRDYIGGYDLYLDELKPLEDYLDVKFAYFVIFYSTASKESYLSIGLKDEEGTLTEEQIKSLFNWIENNQDVYFGKNKLTYTSTSVDVYKKYEKTFNLNNYQEESTDKNYITNEDIIALYTSKKEEKNIEGNKIIRLKEKDIEDIKKNTKYKEVTYNLETNTISNNKNDLYINISVDEKEFEKLTDKEKIKFIHEQFDLYKEMNPTLINMSMSIESKSGKLLMHSKNSKDFFEISHKIKK